MSMFIEAIFVSAVMVLAVMLTRRPGATHGSVAQRQDALEMEELDESYLECERPAA